MILVFPETSTLELVMTSGIIPGSMLVTAARTSRDGNGRVFVESDEKLPKSAIADLTRLGVVGSKRHAGEPLSVSCWPELLPLVRVTPPPISGNTPVLFAVPNEDELGHLIREMLRLGNDRQTLQWLRRRDDAESAPRLFLRVVSPPYYSLLRAIDATVPGLTAYLEQAPQVWVPYGYSHPLGAKLQLPESQILLLGEPGSWQFLERERFQDVYEFLEISLPGSGVTWESTAPKKKFQVPLRLTPSNTTELPSLWVLRDNAEESVDTIVRDLDERIAQRLKFAIGHHADGRKIIVVRTLPGKQNPPTITFPGAIGYRPYWKLPNLYVPVGCRLHPTLRRDQIRERLAADSDQLVWLHPDGQGGFTPESLPEDSFRPLDDWVEYVIEAHQQVLQHWIEHCRFDFEPFICKESVTPVKPRPPIKSHPGDQSKKEASQRLVQPPDREPPPSGSSASQPLVPPRMQSIKTTAESWENRRKELERQFLAREGPLDDPERLPLWRELARANAALGESAQSAICWLHAIWELPDIPADFLQEWVRCEFPERTTPIDAAMIDGMLAIREPLPAQLRAFAVSILAVSHTEPVPAWFLSRAESLRRYFQPRYQQLSARLAWLTELQLSRLAGTDLLGMARVRDGLLQQMLESGLNLDQELPLFLRTTNLQVSEQIRAIQQRAMSLHRLLVAGTERIGKTSPAAASDSGCTAGYIHFLFAFAFARLGNHGRSQELLERGRKALSGLSKPELQIAADFLADGFAYRIQQAMTNHPANGPFPPDLLARLDKIHREGSPTTGTPTSPYRLASYAIDRMREQSRILEPQEKFNPYAAYQPQSDAIRQALVELPTIRNPSLLSHRIRTLYQHGIGRSGMSDAETRFLVLLEGLPLAGRVGEQFTVELLGWVPEAMQLAGGSVPDLPRKQGQMLERALYLAAHFDHREIVPGLIDQFMKLLRSRTEEQRFELVTIVAGQCLRSLRKLGMSYEIDRLLRRIHQELCQGLTLSQLRSKYAAQQDLAAKLLQALLNLAGGWLSYGLTEPAEPILEDARMVLLSKPGWKIGPLEYTRLIQAYIAAVSQLPGVAGLDRVTDFFEQLDWERIPNSFTTAPFYSRHHLNIAEEVVMALLHDDQTLGLVCQRWHDEDEYLIRRRIHRDMKRFLKSNGL
jgi:hypothetical protein